MVKKIVWIALIIILADQITKFIAKKFFNVVDNTGAAYGILEGWQWLFILVALVVIYLVYHYRNELDHIGLGLLLGGTIGNMIDRIILGHVTDFIYLGRLTGWFNIADAANVIGVAIIIIRGTNKK